MSAKEKLQAAIAKANAHDPAGENANEMIGRVASMILDRHGTWDLSENDQRALAFVYGKALAPALPQEPGRGRECCEAMRERAAQVADDYAEVQRKHDNHASKMSCRIVASEIRALSVTQSEGGR